MKYNVVEGPDVPEAAATNIGVSGANCPLQYCMKKEKTVALINKGAE
jgi:hypothetical protein